MTEKRRLLLYLASSGDPHRIAVAPVLAAAAEDAGWYFESYYDAYRAGRHFGAGAPEAAAPGWADGSLVLGGGHGAWLADLCRDAEITAVGDGDALLWPLLTAHGVEELARTDDPVAVQRAVFERFGRPVPRQVLVVDGAPQGRLAIVTSPYCYPRIAASGSWAVDVSLGAAGRAALDVHDTFAFQAVACDPARLAAFPGGVDASEPTPAGGWGEVTAAFAGSARSWGRGVLLGDPTLVASQVAKAVRLRLVPIHGRPTADAVDSVGDLLSTATEPVFGRQWDDHDFLVLARHGRGLQVVDPPPPFDTPASPTPLPDVDAEALGEPSDEQLRAWADEGCILTTLLFWTGMLRELDGLPRLVDLVASTGARVGFVVTAETIEHAPADVLATLAAPRDRGGVLGDVELLLGSTGRGVAAEYLLPPEGLEASLSEARRSVADRLPEALRPTSWWPLLDAALVDAPVRRFGRRDGLPVAYFTPRGEAPSGDDDGGGAPRASRHRDLRWAVGEVARRSGVHRLLEERRPFQDQRPGPFDRRVADAVQAAGFESMWTKAGFGASTTIHRNGSFVALPFTAGNWDGWSPFYTAASTGDLHRATGRLRGAGPGWLVSTVDSPLWAMSGEVFHGGPRLHDLASFLADGADPRLVNVTPRAVARYARILDDRAREQHERSGR